MKYRTDFVTNSSSSSFILAFKDAKDMHEQFLNELAKNAIIATVYDDIQKGKPLTKEELDKTIDIEAEDYAWLAFSLKHERKWRKKHPDANWLDMEKDPEVKEIIKNSKQEFIDNFNEKRQKYNLFYKLEYGDLEELGRALEHEIVPDLPFTIETFSHH